MNKTDGMDFPYKYTIIIPHYNIHTLLNRLLSTIPNRADLQVIVVDDCSNRDLEILNEIKKKYNWVEWFSTETNGGGGKARNIGLSHAKGEYILFADSDDFFNLCFADALDDYTGEEDADIVFFAANSVDTDTFQNSDRGDSVVHAINKSLIYQSVDYLRHKLTAPWAKLISRQLLLDNDIRFQETTVYNDMRFSQLVDYYAKTIKSDQRAIYCVTTRMGSVSSVTTFEKEAKKLEVAAGYFDFAKNHSIKGIKASYFIGPMTEAILRNGWKDGLKEAYEPWRKAGLTDWDIKKAWYNHCLWTKVIVPLYGAYKTLFGPLQITPPKNIKYQIVASAGRLYDFTIKSEAA